MATTSTQLIHRVRDARLAAAPAPHRLSARYVRPVITCWVLAAYRYAPILLIMIQRVHLVCVWPAIVA